MVKRQSPTDVDRYMSDYRMRTPYAIPTPMSRSSSGQHSARSMHKIDAHGRSHARHSPTEAFYHSQGRVEKNSRTKKTYPEKTDPIHHEDLPVTIKPVTNTTTTVKESSCCTIL